MVRNMRSEVLRCRKISPLSKIGQVSIWISLLDRDLGLKVSVSEVRLGDSSKRRKISKACWKVPDPTLDWPDSLGQSGRSLGNRTPFYSPFATWLAFDSVICVLPVRKALKGLS
jgi:hypothetical protein